MISVKCLLVFCVAMATVTKAQIEVQVSAKPNHIELSMAQALTITCRVHSHDNHILSIILEKWNEDDSKWEQIAKQTSHDNKASVVNEQSWSVHGQISNKNNTNSYLTIEIAYPVSMHIGSYGCAAYTINEFGIPTKTENTTSVTGYDPKMDSVLSRLFDIQNSFKDFREFEESAKKTFDELSDEQYILEKDQKAMKEDIENIYNELNKTNVNVANLTDEVSRMKKPAEKQKSLTKDLLAKVDNFLASSINYTKLEPEHAKQVEMQYEGLLSMIADIPNFESKVQEFEYTGFMDGHVYGTSRTRNFFGNFNINKCQDICTERGGYLAELNTEEEYENLRSYLEASPSKFGYYSDAVFFGMTDNQQEGVWKNMLHVSDPVYTGFNKRKIDGGSGQNYAYFLRKNSEWLINDWSSTESQSNTFICEFSPKKKALH